MGRRIASGVFVAGAFFIGVMIGVDVSAQTMPRPSAGGVNPQAQPSRGGQHRAIESNPACQRIISECKRLGFMQGQWKEDNGLWRDCFDPVVKGGATATRDGKPIRVPVSQSDVQACRAAESHRR